MDWKIAYARHDEYEGKKIATIADVYAAGFEVLPAEVPGNFELDLMREGKLEDLYYSVNTLKAQELEATHVWYFTTVHIKKSQQYLHFEGIDTLAEIYINGELVQSCENMFLPYNVFADWKIGENEVLVHIKPVMLEGRKNILPASCDAQKYQYSSLYIRKVASMYGWDIMPRIVSAGIWKKVEIRERKEEEIQEIYVMTKKIELEKKDANLRIYIRTLLKGLYAQEYRVRIHATCGEYSFEKEERLWHDTDIFSVKVKDCQFWWPKNTGKPELYDMTVTLLHGEEICDEKHLKIGIRTMELERTESTNEQGEGEFCFRVNGKKVFVLGTNWVPMDAFHSQDEKRLPKALELLEDIGCNMVRCWGGNIYESDAFYDFCDSHGILVWQDFAMGCAVYPDDEKFHAKIEEEAVYEIKRLRNHPSLALWAGDNENDQVMYGGSGVKRNPNACYITRKLLPKLIGLHDYSRPYLQSSPYMSNEVINGERLLPENHLWGPRDYFKGNYYKNTFCHFASEIGYHGFPAVRSLKKFLRNPEKIFEESGVPTNEYLVHAACMETNADAPYAYRIRLAYKQVETLFGHAEANLEDFVQQSQISQAEAKKYFIEKFRIGKWKRTGIIWWNLLDGWPQISDAVVDYYYAKKLAYHYIKRSQQPVCLMFDEPENGHIALYGVNDLPEKKVVSYRVYRVEGEELKTVMYGKVCLAADSSMELAKLYIEENEKSFYLIEWEMGDEIYKNHYFTNIIDIDYKAYKQALEICQMDMF